MSLFKHFPGIKRLMIPLGHPALQAPGSSQAGAGRVSPRCVSVPACPLRWDFASAGRSPKAVPEKRAAAAAMRGTAAARETAVHRKAGIQAAAPQAQRASSPTGSQTGSPTGSPTISQSRQRMLGLQVWSRSAQFSGMSRTAPPVAPPAKLSAIRRGLIFAALKVAHY